jgi:DNA-binding NarL/FixJ family response regulator
MNLKVLLVDDHTLVRKGLRALLLSHYPGWEISEAENGVLAILACDAGRYDIVLMDHDMPKLDGLTAAKQIIRSNPGDRILMVSMHGEASLAEDLKEIGVLGIIHKNAGDKEFLVAIERIRGGLRYFPATENEDNSGSREKNTGSRRTAGRNGLASLTSREAEIFRLLAAGKPPAAIASALSISSKTLDTHKMSIFRKCGVHSLQELVRFAFQHNAV